MGNVLSVSSAVHLLIGEMVLSRSKHQMCCEALRMKYCKENVSGRVKSRCVHIYVGFICGNIREWGWIERGKDIKHDRRRLHVCVTIHTLEWENRS